MKTKILRTLVSFRKILKKISTHTALKLLRKLVILIFIIKCTQLNCQKMAEYVGMDTFAIAMYIAIIFPVVMHLIAPRLFKAKHEKIFKRLRVLNLVIVCLLVYAKWHCDGYLGTETIMFLALEVGLEVIHDLLH